MSEAVFLSLACPACGGKLSNPGNSGLWICEACKSEYLLRQTGTGINLETFARCPKCLQNDQVNKVSAIIDSQSQELKGTTTRVNEWRDKDGRWQSSTAQVPIEGKQYTELAKKLQPPSKPPSTKRPKSLSWYSAIMIYMGIGFVGMAILVLIGTGSAVMGYFEPLSFFGSIGLCLIFYFIFRILNKKRSRVERAWELKDTEAQKPVLAAWDSANQAWNNLYYCSRDGVVFLPGIRDFAPVDQMREFISTSRGD